MDEGMVSEAVAAICAVDVADGMEYSFERIDPSARATSTRTGARTCARGTAR